MKIKNFSTYTIFFILCFLFIFTDKISAKIIEVCKNCSISSLKKAIQKASAHDTIILHKGIYAEGTIYIRKPLKILGKGNPIIDGQKKEHVFNIRADNVSIEGLTIKNSGQSYIYDFAGIRIEDSKNCSFKNNTLLDNTYSFYIAHVDKCLIDNNFVKGNAKGEVLAGNGVHLWYSKNITVRNNYLSRQRDGLYFEFSDNSEFYNNVCQDNIRYGMHFMFSHGSTFYNNRFKNNQTGVAVMYSKRLKMIGNLFERSTSGAFYGMLLKEITDSTIEKNRFIGNTTGMHVDGSNRNKISRNIFRSNGWALVIWGNSLNNVFSENNFISNNFDISTNSRRNSNIFKRNYWDNYRGYDLDGDKSGDIFHFPVSVFSAWVADFPELAILINSPVIRFLEIAERVFPVLTPKELYDDMPAMEPYNIVLKNNNIVSNWNYQKQYAGN